MKPEPLSSRAHCGGECDSEAETEASWSSEEEEEESSCCPATNWGQIHEEAPRAPGWLITLAGVMYFGGFAISVVALVGEAVNPPTFVSLPGDFRPPLAVVIAIVGLFQYSVECVLAYAGVVVLYSWKPFHVLQHHVAALILASVWNLMAVFDNAAYMDLMRTFRPMRLVAISGGLTGVNEGLWVLSNFAADPKTRAITGARVVCGMACLIQNIGICIPCCVLYVVRILWPKFQTTGSWLALFQIVANGVIQPLAFHLYLQGSFLRLQWKLLCRVWNGEVGRPSMVRPTLAVA